MPIENAEREDGTQQRNMGQRDDPHRERGP
jgi:hypothetical protein